MHKIYRLPRNIGAFFSLSPTGGYKISVMTPPRRLPIEVSISSEDRERICADCPHSSSRSEAFSHLKSLGAVPPDDYTLFNHYDEVIAFAHEAELCVDPRTALGTPKCYQMPDFTKCHSVEVNLPRLILLAQGTITGRRTNWKLYGAGERSNREYACPFRLANVFSSGHICWGGHQVRVKDHLALYREFFSTRFNVDLHYAVKDVYGMTRAEILQGYDHDLVLESHERTDIKSLLAFKDTTLSLSNRNSPGAMLVSDAEHIVEQIPSEYLYHYKVRDQPQQLAFGWGKLTPAGILFDFKGLLALTKSSSLTAKTKLMIIGDKNEIL